MKQLTEDKRQKRRFFIELSQPEPHREGWVKKQQKMNGEGPSAARLTV